MFRILPEDVGIGPVLNGGSRGSGGKPVGAGIEYRALKSRSADDGAEECQGRGSIVA